MKRRIISANIQRYLFMAIWLFTIPCAWSATITTSVDRNPVYMDESFRLTFESDSNVDAAPDFSPLEQFFDIVNRSQGSSMQIINGQVSNKTQWSLTLLPKQAGTFVIPEIRFGRDASQTVTLVVNPPRQGQSGNTGDISLEVTATPRTAYVQAQIIYTVRLFRAVNLVNASLSEPELADGDAVVEKLGDDREYETQRNGVRYGVIERSYAIYPQQSGRLSIKPIVFQGQIVDRKRSVFDPFAQSTRAKRLQSKAILLNIKSIPQAAQGSQWLPAKDLNLAEEWPDPLEFKVGEPVTRTITLKAEGLTAAQLPKIDSKVPEGIKLYPDQPALNDDKKTDEIIGTRQEKIAMIPTQAGDFTLPAIEIPWWNTKQDRQEVARVPARTIHVLAAEPSTAGSPVPPVAQQNNAAASVSNRDNEPAPIASAQEPSHLGIWFWVSIILALGWLLTIIWFVLMRRSSWINETTGSERAESLARLKQGLRRSCINNAAAQAKTSLLEWAKYHWQVDPPKNLGEISKRSEGALANEIDLLNQALYSRDIGQWKGEGLWQAFEQFTSTGKKKKSHTDEILEPLYPVA